MTGRHLQMLLGVVKRFDLKAHACLWRRLALHTQTGVAWLRGQRDSDHGDPLSAVWHHQHRYAVENGTRCLGCSAKPDHRDAAGADALSGQIEGSRGQTRQAQQQEADLCESLARAQNFLQDGHA